MQVKNSFEVPDGKSEWQTRLGMDVHAIGGFSPADYAQPVFAADYPYKPTTSFAGIGKGRDLKDMPWRVEADYLQHPLSARRKPSVGHIESAGK